MPGGGRAAARAGEPLRAILRHRLECRRRRPARQGAVAGTRQAAARGARSRRNHAGAAKPTATSSAISSSVIRSAEVIDAGGHETRLAAVLARQHYRLAWWRTANDAINWRRFFDINELVALRMEHAPAFEDTHALVLRLYAEGLIDGVRVDHVDGLSDPAAYCRTLRQRFDALRTQRPAGAPRCARLSRGREDSAARRDPAGRLGVRRHQRLRFHERRQRAAARRARCERRSRALWRSVSGRSADFAVEEQAARREIIARSFSAQLEACAAAFSRASRAREGTEMSRAALRRSLTELLAHFPVYRGYATAREAPPRDQPFIAAAVAGAKTTALVTDRTAIDHVAGWLSGRRADAALAELQARAVTRFWQLSAPVAAKAVEDTAFYRYGRLLSRNDVGFDVEQFSDSASGLPCARVCARRLSRTPCWPRRPTITNAARTCAPASRC